jgi:hypothetical protein
LSLEKLRLMGNIFLKNEGIFSKRRATPVHNTPHPFFLRRYNEGGNI